LFGSPLAISSLPVQFDIAEVSFWPEYQGEGVLVSCLFELNPNVNLPVQISIPVPPMAKEPFQVSYLSWDGFYYKMPYTIAEDQTGRRITFNVTYPKFVVEFQDNGLSVDQTKRSFSFLWKNEYPITRLKFYVYPPANAQEVVVDHALTSFTRIPRGLIRFSLPAMAGVPGENVQLGFTYQITDPAPDPFIFPIISNLPDTYAKLQPQIRDIPISPYLLGRWGDLLFAGLLILSPMLLIISILLISGSYGKSKMPIESTSEERSASDQQDAVQHTSLVYCHSCGKRARFGDYYCRSCGTKFD
jgi:hypothetical protein